MTAGCARDERGATNDSIRVNDAWVEASVKGRDHTPAYMFITTDEPDALLDANVDQSVAGHTLLFMANPGGDPSRYSVHRFDPADDGRMFTRDPQDGEYDAVGPTVEGHLVPRPLEGGPVGHQVDEIEVDVGHRFAPKGGVPMYPGGYYLMLAKLPDPLVPGEPVKIDLEFKEAGKVTVDTTVREARPGYSGADPGGTLAE